MSHLKLAVGMLLLFTVLIAGPVQAVKIDFGDDAESVQIAIPISIDIVQPHSPLDFERVVALPPEEEWITL